MLPLVGFHGEVLFSIIQKSFAIAISSITILVVSLLIILFSIILSFRRKKMELPNILLGVFFAMASIWIATDSLLVQFLFANKVFNWLLSFITFMLMPIPLLIYLKSIFPKYSKTITNLALTIAVYFLIRIVLALNGIFPLSSLLVISHIVVIICVAQVCWRCFRERQRVLVRYISVVLGTFLFFALISLIVYYLNVGFGYDRFNYSAIFDLGLLMTLVAMLICSSVYHSALKAKAEQSDIFRYQALVDSLTGIGNRVAYENKLKEIKNDENVTKLAGVSLDLNNLKSTNDMYGHTVGDELIRSTAVCLKRAFEDYGGAYRIGGDEFVVIMTEIDEVGVLRCINKLQNILKEENLSRDVPIDLAMGYNCEEILEGKENIDNIFIKADENMYNNKRIIKNNHQNI